MADKWGLVSRIFPKEQLLVDTVAMATRIAAHPAHTLRISKMLLRQGQTTNFDAMLKISAAAQALSHTAAEHRELVEAAISKMKK